MIIHTIVYAVLAVLTAIALYAAGLPIVKEKREEQQSPGDDKDNLDIL